MSNSSDSHPNQNRLKAVKPSGEQTLEVSALHTGTQLEQDIFDKRGILLLAAGSTITDRFLGQLKRHRITKVTAKSASNAPPPPKPKPAPKSLPSGPLETETTKNIDAMIANNSFEGLSIPKLPSKSASRLELNQLREQVKIGLKCVDETTQHYEDQVSKISRGEEADVRQMGSFVQRFADLATKDASLGPIIADFQSDTYQDVSKQVVKTAVLSVAIANYLNLQPMWVNDIGAAALVQDLGMMRVPESIRQASRRLTHDEMLQIKHHPIYSLDILEKSPSISKLVKTIVYQAHERCDGSGYPRGHHGISIHPLAKLLAVADTYSAMTTHKPHRKAMSSYTAVKQILVEAHKNRLDRNIVRSFLDYLSVFPIGSRVLLSDGSTAKVLRSNGSLHTKPVVLRLNDDQTESDVEVDLSKTDNLMITQFLEDAAADLDSTNA